MNKVFMPLLFCAFILTGTSFAQTPPPAAPVAVTAPVVVVHHEHHPELHKAMHRLREAKTDLEKAAHDYGGHKAQAVADINLALGELQAAIEYSNSH